MSEVRDAWDLRLERPVAVKLLNADLAANTDIRFRFESEARSVARLRHPHVVSVFDSGVHGGIPFVVLERLPGETLADQIRAGPLPEPSVRRLASEILGALDHAHRAGIVHRDVKPGNILLTEEGAAKVADFGIAKTMVPATTPGLATSTNQVLGTLAYLSPERIDGKPATPASDLWSLGVALHEALTGQRPFTGDTPLAEALAARQGHIIIPLSIRRPGVSPLLTAAIERSLAPAPELRYQSADAMARALGVGLAGTGPAPAPRGAMRETRGEGIRVTPDMDAGMAPTERGPGEPLSTPAERSRRSGRGEDRTGRQAPRRNARAALAALVAAITAVVLVLSTGAVGEPSVKSASSTPTTVRDRPRPATPQPGSPTTTTSLPAQSNPSTTTSTAPPSQPWPSSTDAPPVSDPPPTAPTTSQRPATSAPPGPAPEGHADHGPPPGHGGHGRGNDGRGG